MKLPIARILARIRGLRGAISTPVKSLKNFRFGKMSRRVWLWFAAVLIVLVMASALSVALRGLKQQEANARTRTVVAQEALKRTEAVARQKALEAAEKAKAEALAAEKLKVEQEAAAAATQASEATTGAKPAGVAGSTTPQAGKPQAFTYTGPKTYPKVTPQTQTCTEERGNESYVTYKPFTASTTSVTIARGGYAAITLSTDGTLVGQPSNVWNSCNKASVTWHGEAGAYPNGPQSTWNLHITSSAEPGTYTLMIQASEANAGSYFTKYYVAVSVTVQ